MSQSMPGRHMRARHRNCPRATGLNLEFLEDRRLLAVFTVTDIGDNGPGTLRDAIDQANALPGIDLITFSTALPANTIHIQTQLEITEGVTIDGGAVPGGMTIDASHADATPLVHDGQGARIFHVTSPNDPNTFQQTRFENLRLQGGDVDGDGGAIHSTTTTILLNTNLRDNAATGDGGAVFVDPAGFGGVFVEDSTFIENSALGKGGALMVNNNFSAYSAIGRVEISGNTADAGGGVYVAGGQSFMVIFDSYLSANRATVNGGGLAAELDGGGASLSVQNVLIHDNEAAYGAGIDARLLNASDMSLFNSTISNNESAGNGGGARLEVADGSSLFSDNNSFLNNSSLAGGGGLAIIAARDGFFNAGRTTIAGNSAATLGGGVFAMALTGGDVRLNSSEIFGNDASQGGGLMSLTAGDALVRVANSALYRNAATTQGGGAFLASYGGMTETIFNHTTISENAAGQTGGGVYVDTAQQPVIFEHSTVAANTQDGADDGGGIFVANNGLIRLDHAIVADNTTSSSGNDIRATNEIFADFSLLEFVQPSLVTGVANLFGVDPILAPLSDNGGETMTHAFALGSPAQNAGEAGESGGQFGDQRGTSFPRVQFGTIDIGAFERAALPTGDVNGNNELDCGDIDALTSAIAAGEYSVTLDLDGNAAVNQADLDQWLALAGAANTSSGAPFLRGDANLDGFVNGADFLVWNAHKFTASSNWCDGDFNADGMVDGSDFILWNANSFGNSTAPLASDRGELLLSDSIVFPAVSQSETGFVIMPVGGALATQEFDSSRDTTSAQRDRDSDSSVIDQAWASWVGSL